VVSFSPQVDTLTYEPYFGLNEKPFSLNADQRFVYSSPTYVATSESLSGGIRRREGLLVLTGEIGTGKTTLCRTVLGDLGRHTYSSLVPDPFVSREDLLKMLLIDFGVRSIQDLTAGPLRQASRTELGYLLSEFLDSLASDAFAVVVIDEAQNLSLPLIEETRILSDTFGSKGRLQIVLVGQPELHAKLKLPEMRQVDQRVCGYHRLAPMSRDAVAGYIQHRLHVAGARCERVLFPPEIVDILHSRSGGVPRLINRISDRALQLAYKRQAKCVDREILDIALIEVGSVTLSPTWDSIIFAEAPTPPRAAAPAPTPAPAAHSVAPPPPLDDDENFRQQIGYWLDQELASRRELPTPAPAPTAAPARAARSVASPPIDDDEHFKKQIDHWVEKDLPPPVTSPEAAFGDEVSAAMASQRRRVSRSVTRRVATATSDWPRDLRSETYMNRLWRKWAKGAAIALAVLVALNVSLVGASLLPAMLTPVELPAPPKAPAPAMPAIALPKALVGAPASVAAPSVTQSGDYLVAVGWFASRDRADQLVDSLTQAGLPAMQRSFQLSQQLVQQIVLGPFFTRAHALADLRRLQALGGYDDASVIDTRESFAQ
jgi:type II secretory pathway predicted ATPase ExeA/cell division septation protein DedD